MATWSEIGEENLRAAKLALDADYFRSAASRAYYAAYASLTGVFRKQNVTFAYGDANPSHDQLLALVTHNLDPKRFSVSLRRQMKQMTTALQATRINADYSPRMTVDRQIATQMVRFAAFVVEMTGEGA